ncbi:CLUMA_CG018918, isoform A, partial [Clunio marinus]
ESQLISAEEIAEKLKAAEERRLNLEARKIADWTAKMAKIEEASRKKDELNAEFMTQTKEALINKMENTVEKREAIISDLKGKLKVHADEIKRNKEMLEKQKVEERNALNDKLKTAANLRDENIKRILDRLREHNSVKVSEVRHTADTREAREEQTRIIENKLFIAERNRTKELEKRLENIRKHERRAMIVRQNKAAISNQQVNDSECPVSA